MLETKMWNGPLYVLPAPQSYVQESRERNNLFVIVLLGTVSNERLFTGDYFTIYDGQNDCKIMYKKNFKWITSK